MSGGCLHLVGTPIGNLEDISLRAVRVLKEVDLVAAEDTRKAKILFGRYGITTPTLSLFEGNEAARVPALVEQLKSGARVALISEAGLPLLSDPGALLVRACAEAGIAIDVAPGPSAITTALLLSGIRVDRFRFVGFLPRTGAARKRLLASIAAERDATVIFESPRRIAATLAELVPLLGERTVALVREMTKLHQEVRRGRASELLASTEASPPRGEITVVVEGSDLPTRGEDDAPGLVRAYLEQGASPRDVARQLGELGYSRRLIYQLAIELSREPAGGDSPAG